MFQPRSSCFNVGQFGVGTKCRSQVIVLPIQIVSKTFIKANLIALFADMVAILIFYCFERRYGMLRGQINVYLPPGHPIIAIRNNRNQNGRGISKKVYLA